MISNPNASFLLRWNEVLANFGPKPAVLNPAGSVLATFHDIEKSSTDWALRLHPLPPRSVVGIQMGNHPDWPAILLALWKNNHIALLLDPSFGADLSAQILSTASARAVISQNGISKLLPPDSGNFHPATALCKVTSGSGSVGGTPRLIEFTSDQLAADADAICETMGLTPDDLNYGAIAFSHSYGFNNLLTPLLTRGIPLVVACDYLPHSLVQGMAATRATILPGLPILYHTLTRVGLTVPDSMRLCLTAGAPLALDTAQSFFQLNNRKIHSFYGASECGGICYDASENPDVPAGFVGQPLQGVKITPVGANGKISVQSPAVGLGYYPRPAAHVLSNGTFHPQDLLEIGDQGIRITGRDSDFINIAGKKLDPRTTENVIEKLPEVSAVVVFGIPHAHRGETAIAAVAPQRGSACDATFILTECRKKLAAWQVPSQIWFCDRLLFSERDAINRRDLSRTYLQTCLVPKAG